MIKIENVQVLGWQGALRGMRNPLNSWDKSDTTYGLIFADEPIIGPNDLKLMTNLCKAGSDERKFLRMIHVQCDITAPVYWVSEHDTYKVGTTRNSCSFMHKGVSEKFSIDDFSLPAGMDKTKLLPIIYMLNELREQYLATKDQQVFQTIRKLLPSGYNVRYTWDANYEVLVSIHKSRKNHRLPEWRTFCRWIEGLPYMERIILAAVYDTEVRK